MWCGLELRQKCGIIFKSDWWRMYSNYEWFTRAWTHFYRCCVLQSKRASKLARTQTKGGDAKTLVYKKKLKLTRVAMVATACILTLVLSWSILCRRSNMGPLASLTVWWLKPRFDGARLWLRLRLCFRYGCYKQADEVSSHGAKAEALFSKRAKVCQRYISFHSTIIKLFGKSLCLMTDVL